MRYAVVAYLPLGRRPAWHKSGWYVYVCQSMHGGLDIRPGAVNYGPAYRVLYIVRKDGHDGWDIRSWARYVAKRCGVSFILYGKPMHRFELQRTPALS